MICSNFLNSSVLRLEDGGLRTIITIFEDRYNSKTSSTEEISWLGYSEGWKPYLCEEDNIKESSVLEHSQNLKEDVEWNSALSLSCGLEDSFHFMV